MVYLIGCKIGIHVITWVGIGAIITLIVRAIRSMVLACTRAADLTIEVRKVLQMPDRRSIDPEDIQETLAKLQRAVADGSWGERD